MRLGDILLAKVLLTDALDLYNMGYDDTAQARVEEAVAILLDTITDEEED